MPSSLEPSGLNTGYVGQLLEQYLDNPEGVDPAWREFFEDADERVLAALPGLTRLVSRLSADGGIGASSAVALVDSPAAQAAVELPAEQVASAAGASGVTESDTSRYEPVTIEGSDAELLAGVAAVMSLVDAIRSHGHLAATLDPLGSEPLGDPALDEAELELPLPRDVQARIPAEILGVYVDGRSVAEVLPRLRDVYMGTIAFEIEHISDHAERLWLRKAIESGRFRRSLPAGERRALLERLAQVEAFETYLRRAFIGQKQF